ncbi:MAG: ATP-binding protein [Thermoanaerobaculaceae bacterium]|nr:ATP-binding protein [Thermoanaerobaculaceae bacterium]
MLNLADLSLRRKLVFAMTATTAVALTVAFVALVLFDRHQARAEMAHQLASLAEVVGSNSSAALMFSDAGAGREILDALRFHPSVVAANLYTAAGKPFVSYRRAGAGPAPSPVRPNGKGVRFEDGRLFLAQEIFYRGEKVGAVQVEADTSELATRQARYGAVILLLALGSVGTTLLVATRLQALVLRPVLRLAAAAKDVARERNYSLRVARVGRDEIGDLTAAFNDMLGEIEARDEALRSAGEELKRHIGELEQEVAERKHAQEALRHSEAELLQAQKMEAVGLLAGGVAHDFNNLLQSILSQAELLRSDANDPGKVEAAARELRQYANRGAALTRQLLVFARREAVKRERLDLNDAVREGMRLLLRLVPASIAVNAELADSELPVDADRGQLFQVLMNLVVNATHAMPDGGAITIRTGTDGHGKVRLSVEDSGHGIPEKIRERIFEPFFTTKDTEKGSGLGLSVVHGILLQHGGQIEVESTVGKGSTFTITLPLLGAGDTRRDNEAVADVGGLDAGRGERILVIEDEDGARETLREILTGLGYEAVAVASGEAAGLLPAEPAFDLLLTDLMLPGIQGVDAARGLVDRWPALSVIIMSGYAEDAVVRRAINAGEVRFLQKPFDMTALAREVRAALDERRPAAGI